MRALTLRPHWAHAVAHLGKRIENRTRPIPPALVGQRVAIHAGATLDEAWLADLLDAAPVGRADSLGYSLGYRLPQPSDGAVRKVAYSVEEDRITEHVVVTRAIVAVATVRPHDPPNMAALWARFAPLVYHASPPPWADPEADYWWALSDVVTLARPVPVARGQLGLWRLDLETDAAVRREEERCSAAP